MKVIHIIHRFPPYYMAGSEIYTHNLTKELAKQVETYIFTRIKNPFEENYKILDDFDKKVK